MPARQHSFDQALIDDVRDAVMRKHKIEPENADRLEALIVKLMEDGTTERVELMRRALAH